jgi:hypothetical protein
MGLIFQYFFLIPVTRMYPGIAKTDRHYLFFLNFFLYPASIFSVEYWIINLPQLSFHLSKNSSISKGYFFHNPRNKVPIPF